MGQNRRRRTRGENLEPHVSAELACGALGVQPPATQRRKHETDKKPAGSVQHRYLAVLRIRTIATVGSPVMLSGWAIRKRS